MQRPAALFDERTADPRLRLVRPRVVDEVEKRSPPTLRTGRDQILVAESVPGGVEQNSLEKAGALTFPDVELQDAGLDVHAAGWTLIVVDRQARAGDRGAPHALPEFENVVGRRGRKEEDPNPFDTGIRRRPRRYFGDLTRDFTEIGRQHAHMVRRVERLEGHRHAEGHRGAGPVALNLQWHVLNRRREPGGLGLQLASEECRRQKTCRAYKADGETAPQNYQSDRLPVEMRDYHMRREAAGEL